MHIFGNTVATSGGDFVHTSCWQKIILYMYYKTNVCQTHNIKRLTIMSMFKILF